MQILNVEENRDPGTGYRYLVEMELKEILSGTSVRFSEYVYRTWGTQALCTPVGVTWNKSAVVNILLTTGNNQGRWILHFLENMARIYHRTKDANFNVVIVDFDSKDIDIGNALRRQQFHLINILIQRGIFQGPWGYRKLLKWSEIRIQFFLLSTFILIFLIISWMMLERLVKHSCSGHFILLSRLYKKG